MRSGFSITARTRERRSSPPIVAGALVIIVSATTSYDFSRTALRMSPSVITPRSSSLEPRIQTKPRGKAVRAVTISSRLALPFRVATSVLGFMTSAARRRSRRPRAPPGCRTANSSSLKPRSACKVAARASPAMRASAELHIGARLRESPSSPISRGITRSRLLPSDPSGLPSRPMVRTPISRRLGNIPRSSSVSPLLETRITTSPSQINPMSP